MSFVLAYFAENPLLFHVPVTFLILEHGPQISSSGTASEHEACHLPTWAGKRKARRGRAILLSEQGLSSTSSSISVDFARIAPHFPIYQTCILAVTVTPIELEVVLSLVLAPAADRSRAAKCVLGPLHSVLVQTNRLQQQHNSPRLFRSEDLVLSLDPLTPAFGRRATGYT